MPRLLKRYIRKILNPIPRCYGKVFFRHYKFLQESQWWPEEQLIQYQVRELQSLLDHCYQNVPYYREIFLRNGYRPADFRSLDELKVFPYLTKDLIRENAE